MAIRRIFETVMEYPAPQVIQVLPQGALCQPGNATQFPTNGKVSEKTAFELMDAIWAATEQPE